MKLLYFAQVREQIGIGEEIVELPTHLKTIEHLIDWLRARDEQYAFALAQDNLLGVAADWQQVEPTHALDGVREVAFFPPMTGG